MPLSRRMRLAPLVAPLPHRDKSKIILYPQTLSTRISMLKAARLARPVPLLALALVAACNSGSQSGVAVLSVTATPRQIDGGGRASLLSVETKDTNGQPGTGLVTLTASAGTFSDGTKQTTLTLANGLAGIRYLCNANVDSSCANQIRIDAS